MAIIVVSIDGVSDKEFERMADNKKQYPNIAKFKEDARSGGSVSTVFLSNTYPVHATVSTGKLPAEHGIISNLTTDGSGQWAQLSSCFKAPTIWEKAAEKGLETAAILWPTTGGANIRYNLPEVHTIKGENRAAKHLRYGSKGFQLRALFRFGYKLLGATPRHLDAFSAAVACDVIRKKRPDLTLIHLLAYDITCHSAGSRSKAADKARRSLDVSLGKIAKAAGDTPLLIFSDHAHLDVSQSVDLEKIFGDDLVEQCGGSAFLGCMPKNLSRHDWFGRFLREDEMAQSGFGGLAECGIAAKPGYCFAKKQYKSNHGYPADYDGYKIFYAVKNFKLPLKKRFGDVRDVTDIIREALGLEI